MSGWFLRIVLVAAALAFSHDADAGCWCGYFNGVLQAECNSSLDIVPECGPVTYRFVPPPPLVIDRSCRLALVCESDGTCRRRVVCG